MPDRVLTLVFSDLVDSTALKSQHGDTAASSLIKRHREVVQQYCDEHDGAVVDWAGDGCFLTFDTPSAAAHFGLDLQQVHAAEPDLPKVRVGIHMGEVTESTVDSARRVEGLAVDLAARIQSVARPDQILLSYEAFNSARQRLRGIAGGGTLTWRAHGPYKFKGFDDAIAIGEVGVEGVAPLTAPEDAEKARRAVAPTDEDTLGWRPAVNQPVAGQPHWILERQLGVGGFGEVWLAANVNSQARHVFKFCFEPDRVRGLKREVVLFKVLKESLGERPDIAGVLDWEFEKPPYFIEAEYTEGGDLKEWAAARGGIGAVPLDTRLDIVAQIATALNAAHQAGVLHKDIKPANILINETGGQPRVRLTDFGIGLLIDPDVLKQKGITATGLTQTLAAGKSSSTSGTGMYMAPELHEGKPPSERSDTYSLGVLLYQLAVGDFSRALAPGWEREVEDPLLREDIAKCVDGRPEHRLESAADLETRLRSLANRRADADAAQQAEADAVRRTHRKARNRRTVVATLAAVVVLSVVGGLGVMLLRSNSETARIESARLEGIPKLKELVETENYWQAFELGMELSDELPGDPTVEEYLNKTSNVVSFVSKPPGATIRQRPYSDVDGEWEEIGVTPFDAARLARGQHRIRLELDGHDAQEIALTVFDQQLMAQMPATGPNGELQISLTLAKTGELPEGMLLVNAGPFIPGITGIAPSPTVIPPFLVDRTEVTNRAFKEFVDAGGYEDPKYWKYGFTRDSRELSFQEAMREFVDATGRPGPANWIQGDYPKGEQEYPVRGVSWFEAAAYAEFRGKELPSVYHWSRMAHPAFEILMPLTPQIVPLSNFGDDGPAPVASHPGIGGSGAFDVAGNVREWCFNEDSYGHRYALGGAWNDAHYMYTLPQAQSPWDRFENNGFRCALLRDNARGAPRYFEPFESARTPIPDEPLTPEIYQIYRDRFRYSATPLDPIDSGDPGEHGDYVEHTVSIAAAYNEERFNMHVLLPTNGVPPYKVSLFMPGINALSAPAYQILPWEEYTFVLKSGRALVRPELAGMYQRGGGNGYIRFASDPNTATEMARKWVLDFARTIDYLATRDDINLDDLGYIGFSFGAMFGPLILGVEDRIEFGVLASGGLPSLSLSTQDEINPATYIRSLTKPVLMMNGRHDYVFTHESHQVPLIENLGTPEANKKLIVYDTGHAPLPEIDVIRDTLDWLDRYQPIGSPSG